MGTLIVIGVTQHWGHTTKMARTLRFRYAPDDLRFRVIRITPVCVRSGSAFGSLPGTLKGKIPLFELIRTSDSHLVGEREHCRTTISFLGEVPAQGGKSYAFIRC